MNKLALLLLLASAPLLAAPPQLESADAGPSCGSKTCTPPETCIRVSGRQPKSSRMECWIPCPDGKTCPTGLSCVMRYDGPGRVCVKQDP